MGQRSWSQEINVVTVFGATSSKGVFLAVLLLLLLAKKLHHYCTVNNISG